MHIHFIHVQQCDYIYQNKFFKCTYVHPCLFHSKLCSAMVCWPIIQHGVRIEAVFASLQQGEHMVESTAVSCIHPVIQTSTIILWTELFSKEEEREDPRRELQSSFQLKSKSVSTRTTVFPHAIQSSRARKLFYIQNQFYYKKSPRNTTTTRLIPCTQIEGILQQVFLMHQSILPGRNSILRGSQHPHSPYSTSQANFTGIHLVLQNSTRRNRIHSKRVKYCISMQY